MKPMSELSLLGPSKTKILSLLLSGDRTAGKLASNLHMQVSAARKHVEQLAALGLVAETFKKGGVGRPKKIYALTEKGREIFPRQYHTLLNHVITKLVERQGAEYAESVMADVAKDVANTFDRKGSRDSEHLKHVLAGLNKLGFDATFDRNDGGLTVISGNCPVWKAALAHGEVVCRGFHAEILKTALGEGNVDRHEWMVEGDRYCKHTVSKPTGQRTS